MRVLRRLVCLVRGHQLVSRGPLLIEGHYIERVECARRCQREDPAS